MSAGRPVRVAVAGLGTVGLSLLRLLDEQQERFRQLVGRPLEVTAVFDRSLARKTHLLPGESIQACEDLETFLAAPADVVVELIGGWQPALDILERSLEQGKAVVTANKLVLARSGRKLLELAGRHGTWLGFEASVAGGIPILRSLQDSLFADRIVSLKGILNGTCNYILTEMSRRGRDFQQAVDRAQALGYAEADPTLDVSGQDAADKLAILSALAFGVWPEAGQIPTRGISELEPIDLEFARRLETTVRLLGVAERHEDALQLRVSPFLVDDRLALASVSGPLNAVEVTGQRLGPILFGGPGAGGDATSVSVAADLLNIARKLAQPGGHPPEAAREPEVDTVQVDQDVYPFYLRFFVRDETGIIARVATILAAEGINLESVHQESWSDKSNLPFMMAVEPAPFAAIQRALQQIAPLPFNRTAPLLVPILRP